MQATALTLLFSSVSYHVLAIPTVPEVKSVSGSSSGLNENRQDNHWIGAYDKSESNYPYGQIDDDEDDEITEDWINNEAHFAPPYSYQIEKQEENQQVAQNNVE